MICYILYSVWYDGYVIMYNTYYTNYVYNYDHDINDSVRIK